MTVLEVENLQVTIGQVSAVRGVSLSLAAGECRALVGESGCGKSMTGLSLLDLLPAKARRQAAAMNLAGQPLPPSGSPSWQKLRGNRLAMIFQNPMTALNPTQKVGLQIAEPMQIHQGLSRRQAWRRAIQLMERLAIPKAEQRANLYPFEFSGGMLQRVMIAMAIACEPEVLIADEPTTALDVGVQAEVLSLLRELRDERGTAVLFITHDLGVVANIADSVSVMYAGQIVEQGEVSTCFTAPGRNKTGYFHPHTQSCWRGWRCGAGNNPWGGYRGPPCSESTSLPRRGLGLGIREGGNRQWRRMTAAVGDPTLRLVRAAVGA